MAYTIFLQVTHPDAGKVASSIDNVRLEVWLTDATKAEKPQVGRKLSYVLEDNKVDSKVVNNVVTPDFGRKPISALGATPAKFIVVLENLFTVDDPLRASFRPTEGGIAKYYLNIELVDRNAQQYKASRYDIILPVNGGVGVSPSGDLISIVDNGTIIPTPFNLTLPVDTTAPQQISGLTARPGNGEVRLSWVNPNDSDFAGVKIQRVIDDGQDTFPSSSSDGTTVYDGNGASRIDTNNIVNDTQYNYRAFAYDAPSGGVARNYQTNTGGATATATPMDDVAELVTSFSVSPISSGTLQLTWSKPTMSDLKGYVIFRSENTTLQNYPVRTVVYNEGDTLGDSVVVRNTTEVNATTNTWNDTSLTDGVAYHYNLYAYDAVPNYYYHGVITLPAKNQSGATATNTPWGKPVVLTAIATNATTLRVIFNEGLDRSTAIEPSYYNIVELDNESRTLALAPGSVPQIVTSTNEENPWGPKTDDTAVLQTLPQQGGVQYKIYVTGQ